MKTISTIALGILGVSLVPFQSTGPSASATVQAPSSLLIDRTFGSPSCETGYQRHFERDYTSTISGDDLEVASLVRYETKGAEIRVRHERDGKVEIFRAEAGEPRLVGIEFDGIRVAMPAEDTILRPCASRDVPEPIGMGYRSRETTITTGGFYAISLGDAAALRAFVERGLDLQTVVAGRTLAEWSSTSQDPAIASYGTGDAFRLDLAAFETMRSGDRPWSTLETLPIALQGRFECGPRSIRIASYTLTETRSAEAPRDLPIASVHVSGGRYLVEFRNALPVVLETGPENDGRIDLVSGEIVGRSSLSRCG